MDLGDVLRRCVTEGSADPLRGRYAPDAVLDTYLPGVRETHHGEDAILAALAADWTAPGEPVSFEVLSEGEGVFLRYEVHHAHADVRRWHVMRTGPAGIAAHVVYSDRPRLVPHARDERYRALPDVLPGAVERAPFTGPGAYSGNPLERYVMADGSAFVVKHIAPAWDWLMRATRDDGREALLHRDGVLSSLPAALSSPVVDVVEHDGGWAVVMRDAGTELFTGARSFTRDETRQLLGAAAALHARYESFDASYLCSIEDRLLLFSAATAERERLEPDVAPKLDARVWELFADGVPADVAEVVFALVRDIGPLCDRLRARPTSLCHGDLKPTNLGFSADRALLAIDWQLACAAPPAVDFVWMLNFAHRFEASMDEMEADFVTAEGPRHDPVALDLAVMGHMVMAASALVVDVRDDPDPSYREGCQRELDWWVARTRRALERTWSPV